MIKNIKENGITLIALVITIVVLIILAAVAINLSLGNNGIFNRAKTAKEQYTNAQEYEQKEVGKTGDEIEGYINGNRDTVTLTKEQYQSIIDRLDALENINKFSNEEKEIGTFPVKVGDTIVNKKLYQITYIGNTPSSSSGVLCTIPSLDKFIYAYGSVLIGNGNTLAIAQSGTELYRKGTSNEIAFGASSDIWLNKACSITILYTKTTD